MAPRLPMPRITLKRRPSSRNDSPGLSSVPASIEPIITLEAPAASALTTSPEYLMPPSAMTGTSPAPRTASRMAVICGTPTPVTTRVVQIEPGPTPTFTASTPRSTSWRAAVLVLVGIGVPPAFEDVLDGDEAPEDALLVDDRQLFDAVLGEEPLRLLERRADGCRDQALLRHRGANRAVELALELEVAIGDDADQAPRVVHHRDAGDAEPLHQPHRLPQRAVGAERDGMEDHPRLAALDPVHLGRLTVDRHVLVHHADPALARDRHRHLRLGHRVHRGRDERQVERDAPGEARADVDVARMHTRVPRNEQDVVEGEGGARAEGSHGESYWGGGGSSTFSGGFFPASSTAAFPAAANFSRILPAFPTASIVPRMMFTGTRPARSVSSSVSATLWNGAAPAGRSAYFDSRNST